MYNIFFRKGGRRRKPILATSKKGVSLANNKEVSNPIPDELPVTAATFIMESSFYQSDFLIFPTYSFIETINKCKYTFVCFLIIFSHIVVKFFSSSMVIDTNILGNFQCNG